MKTLQLYIWKDDSIRNIQEKFSDLFPGLQIKIFKHMGNKIIGKAKKEDKKIFLSKIEVKGDGFENTFEDFDRKEFDSEYLVKLFIKEYLILEISIPQDIIINCEEPEIIYE